MDSPKPDVTVRALDLELIRGMISIGLVFAPPVVIAVMLAERGLGWFAWIPILAAAALWLAWHKIDDSVGFAPVGVERSLRYLNEYLSRCGWPEVRLTPPE